MGFSISNLAEKLVQGLTGSEALGDVAGIATAYFTGDIKGVASQSFDLADNVGKAGKSFLGGVWQAAKNAIKEFSNPGRVQAPTIPKGNLPGWSPAQQFPTNPRDTGVGQGGSAIKGHINDSFESILNNPSLSLETKILLILLKLQGEKRKEMKDRLNEAVALKNDKNSGEGDAMKAQHLLQQSANELNELSQLTTNLMKLFHDMKMATVQNIR